MTKHWQDVKASTVVAGLLAQIADLSACLASTEVDHETALQHLEQARSRLASLDAENTALRAQVATRIGYEVVAKDFRVIEVPSRPQTEEPT